MPSAYNIFHRLYFKCRELELQSHTKIYLSQHTYTSSYFPKPDLMLLITYSEYESIKRRPVFFHDPHTRSFRLLDLPPEIRNKIYIHFIRTSKIMKKGWHYARTADEALNHQPPLVRSLLLTCKTIWYELVPLLFGSTVWVAGSRMHGIGRQQEVCPEQNWVSTPSTMSHPTSGNIRHVFFNMRYLIAGYLTAEQARFSVEIWVLSHRFKVIAVVRMRPRRGGFKKYNQSLKKVLELRAGEKLRKLAAVKMSMNESTTNFMVEDWQKVAQQIKDVYMG